MSKAIEAAMRLIGLIQQVYVAIIAPNEQLLRSYTVACAVGREAMQLHLHLLKEAELLESKHAVLMSDVVPAHTDLHTNASDDHASL